MSMLDAAPPAQSPSTEENGLSIAELGALVRSQAQTIEALRHQLEWFRRQMFGRKSERYIAPIDPQQMHLGEAFPAPEKPVEARKLVPAHSRRVAQSDMSEEVDTSKFFDESRVPIHTIELSNPQTKDLSADQYEVIGQKVSYRLGQRPGSYVVLKYVRPVIKLVESQQLHCPAAPVGMLEGSRADVSFIVGLLIDKFAWHLPLYRQHQRLHEAGLTVSRPWLTQLVQQAIGLLQPIYMAQFDSIRASRVKAIDETPIKAGRSGHGKMKQGYFWPVYGDRDEICFAYFASRAARNVHEMLGQHPAEGSVLLSDGYVAYESYTRKLGLTHAQCWSHTRRAFFEAQAADPEGVSEALEHIQVLYAIEEEIRKHRLSGQSKRLHRLTYSKPRVEVFFDWIDRQFKRQGLLPSNPFTKALNYARERRLGLEVFLSDPEVPLDTNHLERALRVIPMGRKAWLFCWTELGAEHVGIAQSLIKTCRLQGIDPYTYLVDVLQRVSEHPASRVAELTPRLWKQHFAANPMRSDLDLQP